MMQHWHQLACRSHEHGVDPCLCCAGSWVPRSSALYPSAAAAAAAGAAAEAAEAAAVSSRALSPEGEAAGAGEAVEAAAAEAGALGADTEGYFT